MKFQQAAESGKPFRTSHMSKGYYWWFSADRLVHGKYPSYTDEVRVTTDDLKRDWTLRNNLDDAEVGDTVINDAGKKRMIVSTGRYFLIITSPTSERIGTMVDYCPALGWPRLEDLVEFMRQSGYTKPD